jgi:galactokinase
MAVSSDSTVVTARAPGRVNLIGDHTDYTGGLCFPIAIDRAVEISGRRDRALGEVRLTSDELPDAVVALDVSEPASVQPDWARYVAGVVGQLRPAAGFSGVVRSDLPAGSGLSSSAALEVACALAMGADRSDPIGLARMCQAAEHAARGVPTGLLDQLASICGVKGSGLHLDCRSLEIVPVPLPPSDVAGWLVIWAAARSLADSGYADRVAELATAEATIGPLRDATTGDLASLDDPTIRSRARHVLTENRRVDDFATAIASGDLAGAGALMSESHRSLSGDFACATASIDELCKSLWATPGVYGARMTGGGWGGCVVALTDPGAVDATAYESAWWVEPSPGADVRIGE